jgi:hypothetical protein
VPELGFLSAGRLGRLGPREMPESDIRTAAVGGRREGRRSHAAYGSHARGSRLVDQATRIARRAPWDRKTKGVTRESGTWTAGTALAAVFSLVRRGRRVGMQGEATGAGLPHVSGRGSRPARAWRRSRSRKRPLTSSTRAATSSTPLTRLPATGTGWTARSHLPTMPRCTTPFSSSVELTGSCPRASTRCGSS